MTDIKARTDRRRQFLLCGPCGLSLGLLGPAPRYTDDPAPGRHFEVWLPTDWVPESQQGVALATTTTWRLSKHGYWHLRHLSLPWPEIREDRRSRPERREDDGRKVWVPYMPALIACPTRACGVLQEMDAATLGVTNRSWPRRRWRTINERDLPPDRLTPTPGAQWNLPEDGREFALYMTLMKRLRSNLT